MKIKVEEDCTSCLNVPIYGGEKLVVGESLGVGYFLKYT